MSAIRHQFSSPYVSVQFVIAMYRMQSANRAVRGKSINFKRNTPRKLSLRDLYRRLELDWHSFHLKRRVAILFACGIVMFPAVAFLYIIFR